MWLASQQSYNSILRYRKIDISPPPEDFDLTRYNIGYGEVMNKLILNCIRKINKAQKLRAIAGKLGR